MDLRELPAVDALQRTLSPDLPPALATEIARRAVDRARRLLIDDGGATVDPEGWARREAAALGMTRPRRVINATGVLLNTNLGRAPQPGAAADAARAAAGGYSNLELDLSSGTRGGRGRYAEAVAAAVTGTEAALAVNNNAGALLLALAAVAGGGAVAISRGELIEIGGSFRLPEVMAASGVRIIEVGTTNRTRLADYTAVFDKAAAVLKVHPSNYRVTGFTAEVEWDELGSTANAAGVPYIADVGSGLIDAGAPWLGTAAPWLDGEPGVRQIAAGGADLVLFSGDKLLGGPQAGVIVGKAPLVAQLRRHPLARALRIGGPPAAALAATLELYAAGRAMEIPLWQMAALPAAAIEERARRWADACGGEVAPTLSLPGAGSVPGKGIPSAATRIPGHADSRWRSLLRHEPPIVARRDEDAVLLDPRSVFPDDDPLVAEALAAACR